MNNKLYPIGSICTTKKSNKKVMITGYYAIEYSGKVKMFDYIGTFYPEGLLSANKISFNHSDIVSLIYNGYEDEDYENLVAHLQEQKDHEEGNSANPVFANVEVDENNVVVFHQPVVEAEPERKSTLLSTLNTSKESMPDNPFHMNYEQKVETKTQDDQEKWPIFKNIKFDENGVVISAEE